MNFLVQGLNCSEECFANGFYKGSTTSEGLSYLEFEGGFAEGAALSSDGEQVAWTDHNGGLFLSEIEARRTTTLVRYRDLSRIGMVWHYDEPVFAPEQDRVIFNWYAHCFQESCEPFAITSHEELHFSSTAGENDPVQISSWPSEAQEPAISSDGGRIAFVSTEEEPAIWMMDTSGNGAMRITTRAMGFYAIASPSFAPEGERITFEGTPRRGATPQIYTVNVNGSELVQLTTLGGTKPQWSPDETFVAYTEIRNESIERIDPNTARALSPLVASPPSGEGEKINRVILPQADKLKAVHTFEPVLRFDSSEQWRPLNVDDFLAEGVHRLCDRECDEEPIRTAEDLEHHSTTTSYIDVEGTPEEGNASYHSPNEECVTRGLLDCDTGPSSAIYYRVTRPFFEGEVGYRYIDYWAFYRANYFNEEIDFHEGDWEGVTIAPSASNPRTFDYAAFSQHGRFYSYLRNVLRCEDTNTGEEIPAAGTCGTEAERSGQRVAVMVAHGDHANYTTPCSETIALLSCSQNARFRFERGYDGLYQWGNAFGDRYTTLVPLPPAAPGYTPSEGPDPEAWNAGPHGWADWPGRWGIAGEPIEGEGPRSPFNQRVGITCASLDNAEGECALGPRTASAHRRPAQALSPGLAALSCSDWIGANIAATLCNPHSLRAAIAHRRLSGIPSFRLHIAGRAGRAVSAPGIIQLAGRPLQNGGHVQITGAPSRGTSLMLRIAGRGRYRHNVYLARFANVRQHLPGRAVASASRARIALTLHVGAGYVTRAGTQLGGIRASAVTLVR